MSMSGGRIGLIIGAAAGAALLLALLVVTLIRCFFFRLSHNSTNSDTASSDPTHPHPSLQVGRHLEVELSIRETRHFHIDELSLATRNFSDNNLVGVGKFGDVYKGLLHDGMLVAIKKRSGSPSQQFIDEVHYLSPIQHRNLVTLLGYCQENNLQFLVYEYIPNGSVSGHLYGIGQHSSEKLEFKHRLSIALGAAKGLAYLHSLSPRLVHKDFKTANVLVDENFISKVADAGLRNFLGKVNHIAAGPSSQVTADEIFLAPEVKEFGRFSEKSDVYSFGVFLLELVSGQEATEAPTSGLSQNLVEWVQNLEVNSNISSVIDERMGNRFTSQGIEGLMELIIQCVHLSSERRPVMSYVVTQLDRILEKEMSLTTVMGEATPIVIPGSQLFGASK